MERPLGDTSPRSTGLGNPRSGHGHPGGRSAAGRTLRTIFSGASRSPAESLRRAAEASVVLSSTPTESDCLRCGPPSAAPSPPDPKSSPAGWVRGPLALCHDVLGAHMNHTSTACGQKKRPRISTTRLNRSRGLPCPSRRIRVSASSFGVSKLRVPGIQSLFTSRI